MVNPQGRPIKLLVELEPRGRAFWSALWPALWPVRMPREAKLGPWRDVFVRQGMPWGRFVESAVLHAGAAALIWMVSLAWLQQQNIVTRAAFDQSSVITYSPQEYLPPLDTGAADTPREQPGDPVYARQAILSVPPEADNRTQTIVVPPDLKLDHDVPLPNIVATGKVAPTVPLEATREAMKRNVALDTAVVAPAPDVSSIRDHVISSAMTSEIIAPPPEVSRAKTRNFGGPEAAVVAPPPEFSRAAPRQMGTINIGTSAVVAPAPQLAVAPQRALMARGIGGASGGGMQPVAPPPSIGTTGGTSSAGRLIALGIHPVAPTGPIAVPGGNRRGTFAAGPEGTAGASGTPRLTGAESGSRGSGSKGNGGGFGAKNNGSLPAGLHVGAANSNLVGPVERKGSGAAGGDGGEDPALLAKASVPRTGANAKPLVPVTEDRVTEADRQVFGVKRIYSMTLNLPNLTSVTGSWVIRFAELKDAQKEGELLAPVLMEKSDPGYPIELMRENVHGSVTLYAVIHSDGHVSDIRVISSPDERLDPFAEDALSRWKFLPALKAGKPVALEAVVVIPFRSRREF
jgi:TonB family protein